MKTIVLILWALMGVLCTATGQTMPAAPGEGETIPTSGQGSSSSEARMVCPGSQEEYFVLANLTNMPSPDQISFQWRVYGGVIDGDPDPDLTTYNCSYSEITLTGVNASNQSKINITWDNKTCQEAWIALRQISEHGCVSTKWAVFHIDMDDIEKPTFEIPSNKLLCELEGQDSVAVDNIGIGPLSDNCSPPAEISVDYSIVFPDNTTVNGEDDASGTNFPVGTSVVTYKATDKWGNSTSKSLSVIVNPLPDITEISFN